MKTTFSLHELYTAISQEDTARVTIILDELASYRGRLPHKIIAKLFIHAWKAAQEDNSILNSLKE